ncbi:MAG: CoA-binding domain protein [Burkholderiales bacterium]|nr:CoA-binding domain protein [Burkholderiales bacterium]
MLGPNSAGVFSAAGALNCLGWKTPRGRIAVITQSGNMAVTFTEYAKAKSAGLASVMALGNSADLKLSELVEFLQHDEQTGSIIIYCEGFSEGDGRRLVEVAKAAPRKLPIVMLKPGVSEAGRIAAKSHTGSLTGEDAVVSAALAEAGIIRAEETEEAFDMALALAACVPPGGRRVVVLSDGGGHATIVSDYAGRCGLQLARLSDASRKQLRALLPERAAIANPIDFAGFAESDPDSTAKAIEICMNDGDVDGAIFAGHFGGYYLMTEHAETRQRISSLELQAAGEMVEAARRSGKPLILHSEYGEHDLSTLAPIRDAELPIYSSLESAAKAMAALYAWGSTRGGFLGSEPRPHDVAATLGAPRLEPQRVLAEPQSRDRLSAFGIPVPEYVIATSAAEAVGALRRFGTSVAMKLIASALVHKSDAGGVILGLDTENQVRVGFRRLKELAARLDETASNVLVTPMIKSGVECIIGARRDPQFGPIVVFGAGGILVELVKDIAIRLAPMSITTARSAIESSVVGKLLRGFRGSTPADLESLSYLLVKLSEFIVAMPDVQEIDLNPVIANEHGAFIADARLVVT